MGRHDRIPRLVLSPVGTSYLYNRNPWVPVWWSIILPGFGHITVGQNLRGLILMTWEIMVNTQAHINLAIYHTILGQIDQAKAVIDYRWAVLYPAYYAFTMWDAYRVSVEYNRLSRLERLQKQRRFDRVSISVMGIHGLDRRSPALAAFWSAALTGLGHLLSNRILKAFVMMAWYLAVVLKSGLSLSVFHTIRGEFALARQSIDYQWLLYWPSIFVFGIVDAYADAAEQNDMADMAFRYRIRQYLRNAGARR